MYTKVIEVEAPVILSVLMIYRIFLLLILALHNWQDECWAFMRDQASVRAIATRLMPRHRSIATNDHSSQGQHGFLQHLVFGTMSVVKLLEKMLQSLRRNT